MTYPTIAKFTAAGQLLNQRITFSSLNQTLSAYWSIISAQAIAKGYTRVGSSNGTTAVLDGANRWSSTAAVRGATTTTAQSWDIIQAANGAQTLFYYTGGSDDVAAFGCSPGGLYVLAGTPTFKPTATDEITGSTGATLIGNTASGDRIADVWIDVAANGWRACMFRSNIAVGALIWCELFDPAFVISPASVPVPVWTGINIATQIANGANVLGVYSAGNNGGSTRVIISSVATIVNMGGSSKMLSGQSTAENGVALELNGGNFLIRPVGLSSFTLNAKGDVGNRFDWYIDHELLACGQLDASKSWLYINAVSTSGSQIGVLWPWDGASAWVGI